MDKYNGADLLVASSHSPDRGRRVLYLRCRRGDVEGNRREPESQMAESQMAELQNISVLLEEARAHVGNLAGHRRARLEVHIRGALREIDDQIEDLRPHQ